MAKLKDYANHPRIVDNPGRVRAQDRFIYVTRGLNRGYLLPIPSPNAAEYELLRFAKVLVGRMSHHDLPLPDDPRRQVPEGKGVMFVPVPYPIGDVGDVHWYPNMEGLRQELDRDWVLEGEMLRRKEEVSDGDE